MPDKLNNCPPTAESVTTTAPTPPADEIAAAHADFNQHVAKVLATLRYSHPVAPEWCRLVIRARTPERGGADNA